MVFLLKKVRTGYNGPSTASGDDVLTTEQLRSHFSVAMSIKVEMSSEPRKIITSYYKMCRSDPWREKSRTTPRLLDSLNRLTEAHAKLLFRSNARAIDAIVAICMMETSFSFGRILTPFHPIREELPLGPQSQSDIQNIYSILELGTYVEDVNVALAPDELDVAVHHTCDADDDALLVALENLETSHQSHENILGQEKRKNSWNIDDTDDEVLSLMLGDFEESYKPKREIKKFKDINLN